MFDLRLASLSAALALVALADDLAAQELLLERAGDFNEDRFGFSVAAAGDVDADGFADVIVGAIRDDNNGLDSGSARILSGLDGSTLHLIDGNAGDRFGYAVSTAGDVDADGFADVIVGAPEALFERGYARVHSGASGAALHTFSGQVNGDWFGVDVASLGDLDSDGHDDVVVGAGYGASGRGEVTVYSGVTGALLRYQTGQNGENLGWSVAGPGDTILDGFVDVLAGSPVNNANGGAKTFSGQDGAILHWWPAPFGLDRSGWAVSGAGDVNEDGFTDVLVGAPDDDTTNGVGTGSVRLYSGINGFLLHEWLGDSAGDEFGTAVDGGRDVDGDGVPDVVVGAPRDDDGAADAGRVSVLSGQDGALLWTVDGDAASDLLGHAAAHAGDLDADGFGDWIGGAYAADDGGNLSGEAKAWSRPCGSTSTYGNGCPGSGGFVPALAVSGCAVPGASLELEITGGLGGGAAVLFAGGAAASLPMAGGCTLLLLPALPVGTFPLPGAGAGNGALSFGGVVPATAPAGSLKLQVFTNDPGVPHGFAASNAVDLTIE